MHFFKEASMRRTCQFLAFFCLFYATTTFAGPASPDVIEINQPDGTIFKARIHGDEFQNWIETVDRGYTVVYNNLSRQWEYAEKNRDGTLQASGNRVWSEDNSVPTYIRPGLRPERDTDLEMEQNHMIRRMYEQRLALSSAAGLDESSGPIAPGSNDDSEELSAAPIIGARPVLIVLVKFANRSLITTANSWNGTIFDTTPGVKSVVNYYKDNSFGNLVITPAAHSQPGNPAGIITVTVADSHPNSGSNFNYTVETTILNHALAQAASYLNFASFDSNNNGTLEQSELAIYFIYAGYEASGSSSTPNIWAHAWGGSVTAGTKTVTRWALNGELNGSGVQHPMGVIAHELGHALCGLPDLYDTSYTNAGMGNFSMMAGGSWGRDTSEYGGVTPVALDAWSRAYLGWTTPALPGANGAISLDNALASANNVIKLVNSSVSSTEYWLVENRYAASGWDRGLRGLIGSSYTGGILIIHVDSAATINRYVSNGHQGVMPEQASTASCNMVTSTCRGAATTLFYSGNNANFGLATTPNTNYYSGAMSDIALSNISLSGATMTLNYNSAVTSGYAADGKPDILWRDPVSGEVSVWYMNGVSRLATGYAPSCATTWSIAGVADFNGDSKRDILWRNSSTGQVAIWFMNGAIKLSSALTPTCSTAWSVAGVGDFDGDGRTDILWRNSSTGQNSIWFMDGVTKLSSGFAPSCAAPWYIAGVADFNGDSKQDILWRNSSTDQVAIWFMSGLTKLSSAFTPSCGAAWLMAGIADFNGDSRQDIIWRNPSTSQVAIWFMDGVTKLSSALAPSVVSDWSIAGIADFDGDNKNDFLWKNSKTGQVAVWFMDGATKLSSALAPSALSRSIVAGIF
jgi:M6 family metalloprotease-like protein